MGRIGLGDEVRHRFWKVLFDLARVRDELTIKAPTDLVGWALCPPHAASTMTAIILLAYGLASMIVCGDGCVAMVGIKPTLRDHPVFSDGGGGGFLMVG